MQLDTSGACPDDTKMGKKPWLANLIRDLSPTSNGSNKEFTASPIVKKGPLDSLPMVVKILGAIFAMIGVFVCLRWIAVTMATLDLATTSVSVPPDNHAQSNSNNNKDDNIIPESAPAEECAPNEIISEFSSRLQLLENAFKEQVFARETIAREVNDQSDVYTTLEGKLTELLRKLDNISSDYRELETKYNDLYSRVYSDEMLSLVVVLMVVLDIVYHCHPLIVSLWNNGDAYRHKIKGIIPWPKIEQRSSSRPSTPKHSAGLRNEICLTTLQTNNAYQNLFDAMLRHLDGVKIAVKPYFGIFSADDIKNMPVVRLYVILVDVETRPIFCNGTDNDLLTMTIRFTKSIRSNVVVILANDDGSKNLTAHSVYNSSLRLVKTNEFLQDLAANGRLFSMWQEMTSHQLSHLRRTIKTVLNLKSVIR